MGRFMFAVLLLLMALLQATFFPATDVLGIFPDITLVFLLVWCATRGIREGLILAFVLGLWIDVLTLDPLGTHALALLVVAAIGGVTRGRLFRSSVIFPFFAVLVATLSYNLFLALVGVIGGEAVNVVGTMRLAVMTSLLNALIVPLAYVVLLVIDRWVPHHVV